MPGSALLDPQNLVDDLLSVIDDVRGDLHPALGVRQFRVFTVLRTWSGEERGDGTFNEVETELTPQPLVEAFKRVDRLEPSGLDEADVVRVSELSLTYTEAEITGPGRQRTEEWLIRIKDAYGQGIRVRDFVLEGSPWPDRTKTIGWTFNLQRASDAEAL
jgi:hypothetical protein